MRWAGLPRNASTPLILLHDVITAGVRFIEWNGGGPGCGLNSATASGGQPSGFRPHGRVFQPNQERTMKLIQPSLLFLPVLLAGCGGSPLANTVSVTCDGSLRLAGAKSIDVVSGAANTEATLSFPDPVNEAHTGTIQVTPGSRCTIAPTSKV